MPLIHFPVTGTFQAVIPDSADAGGDPDLQNISAFVYFEPSVKQVFSTADQKVYRLETIRGRMNVADGQVKTIDGSTLSLPANSAALNLPRLVYTVTFDAVVFNKQERTIESFKFVAPTTNTPVNLATVPRVTE